MSPMNNIRYFFVFGMFSMFVFVSCHNEEQSSPSEISLSETMSQLVSSTGLATGADPKLYGKTLDNKDFDWENFRGKYVLVKFTATWCGPCKREIPGMLAAYEKYHDKGLDVVSVYISENSNDPVETVKKAVAHEKLPWVILSEELTRKSGQPEQGNFYGIEGVPTMILVNKEGKIIMTEARGSALQTKLAEIFE